MPVFDWSRSELYESLPDVSTAHLYDKSKVEAVDPMELVERITTGSEGYTMPGWESERLKLIKDLFKSYEDLSEEDLWNNLKYFLEAIIPVAQTNDIKMAIHPDDPPWPI